ncbi:MAG: phosphatidylserine decarboxylase, partial [Paenibacillaceae bacterium]|nr:phosphatidylserine decarboxylase [Paenibacillaceae bacterium]
MFERSFRLLTELSSRKWVSKLAGRFAKSRLSRRFIPRFVKTYGIDWQEAEKPLNEYETLNEFFTRKLKRGGRPVHADTNAVVSPVDGLITGMGNIESGRMLNIKGQDYTVEALLNGSPRTVNYLNGFYYVLYLSPKDYHRIHSPVSGKIIEKEYIPGRVYPVNDFGLRH